MGGHVVKGVRFFAPPLRRLSVAVIVFAVVIGGVVWYFGLGIPQSALVAVAFAAVGATWIAVQEGEKIDWPKPPARRTPGARRDLETLSWSMKTRGGVGGQSLARVREATRHRLLFLYGLDLYDPADREAVERYLAPGVVRILLTPSQNNLNLSTFTRCLTALERLGSPSAPGGHAGTSTERHFRP
ncbi:hypothetical protein [Frondihabitans australicus]|uniref:Uncharacterized protein n=1 Tax=Frondihabitans australicus TaxID=386892 RepID=A0A495ILX1_9MICO|nr:hypothetical protein [Frondihabitans australicus]RKR76261.1 hypothetical protein C8E83_3427 [Frondihabitans australicus]